MSRRTWSIGSTLASVALVLALGACSDAPLPTAQSAPGASLARGGPNKLTFEGVTLVDGDLEVEDAVIEAAVRDQKRDKNDWTSCSYFTEGWATHLGRFGAGVVPGDEDADGDVDDADVRAFCVDRFEDRQ